MEATRNEVQFRFFKASDGSYDCNCTCDLDQMEYVMKLLKDVLSDGKE
jgi:hypothetical protein